MQNEFSQPIDFFNRHIATQSELDEIDKKTDVKIRRFKGDRMAAAQAAAAQWAEFENRLHSLNARIEHDHNNTRLQRERDDLHDKQFYYGWQRAAGFETDEIRKTEMLEKADQYKQSIENRKNTDRENINKQEDKNNGEWQQKGRQSIELSSQSQEHTQGK